MVAMISETTPGEWRGWRAEARLAISQRTANPAQRAFAAMSRELGEHAAAMSEGSAIPHNVHKSKVPAHPTGITKAMLDCIGYYYCPHAKTVLPTTFSKHMTSEQHLEYSAWLVGLSGSGKSQLQRRCAKLWATMYKHDSWVYSKGLDPLGSMTKTGVLGSVGSVHLADFRTTSQNGVRLETQGLKALVDCFEVSNIEARYAMIRLEAHRPRTFSVQNLEWFGDNGYACLAAMAKGELDLTPAADLETTDTVKYGMTLEDCLACCRRTIVFVCPKEVVNEEARTELRLQTREMVQEGLRRVGLAYSPSTGS